MFPLKLTPFEEYMLIDDRDAYPMSFTLQFEFRGIVQRHAWEAALSRTLTRHPLLTAMVRSGREWFIPDESPGITVQWEEWRDDVTLSAGERIDLSREPGFRVWTQPNGEQTRVTCQTHHASSDAFGLMAFMEDWLLAYEAELAGERQTPHWERIDPEHLRQRGASRWPSPLPEPVSRWQAISSICREAARWAFRKPMPMRAGGAQLSNSTPFPGIRSQTLSQEITTRLRDVAREKSVTFNDLLLVALFRTLSKWNRVDQTDASRRWLKINMPTNLRSAADNVMSAANVLGYAFLTRRVRTCHDHDSLLAGIASETAAIRKWNLGQNFLDSLAAVRRVPGFLNWLTSRSSCLATTVLSNLGDVTHRFRSPQLLQGDEISAGGLTLQRVLGTSPLRPFTRAAFMVATCRGQLTICARWDHTSLDEATGQQLLDLFVHNVVELAEPSRQSSPP